MSSAETVCRQWDILELIPQLPHYITARQIHQRLPQSEYDVSLRTVQRDLIALSRKFSLTCETDGRVQQWSWMKDSPQLQLPRMKGSMAATLLLARDYLKPLLPAGVLGELDPFFKHAADVLDDTPLKGWNNKVRILDRGPMLIPPTVKTDVRDAVYQALLDERQLDVAYKARGKDQHKHYVVNPLGLVVKGGVFYLVVTFDGYDDIRQLALHRINKVQVLKTPYTPPTRFSLKAYVEDEAGFSYPVSPDKIKLEAVFDKDIAFHLTELKLAPDQTVTVQDDGTLVVKATVANSEELRWWLRGFGGSVKVKRPNALAEELRA